LPSMVATAAHWFTWRRHRRFAPDWKDGEVAAIEIRCVDNGHVLLRVEASTLAGARLAGAGLRFAHPVRATLRGADLRGANLWLARTFPSEGKSPGATLAAGDIRSCVRHPGHGVLVGIRLVPSAVRPAERGRSLSHDCDPAARDRKSAG